MAKYWLGKHRSKETKEKIRAKNIGKKQSKETIQKRIDTFKEKGYCPKPPINLPRGFHQSNESKEKNRNSHLGKKWGDYQRERMSGSNSPAWKGGITKSKNYKRFKKYEYLGKKIDNGGTHTVGDWENLKAQYNFTCPSCRKSEPEIKLTEDHIIPISKGGSDNIENIQPLCGSCNSKKMTKIIKYEFLYSIN